MLKIKKATWNYRDDEAEFKNIDVSQYVSEYALYKQGCCFYGNDDSIPLEQKPKVIAEMFGKLVEVLVNKKILNAEDISQIVGDYREIELVDVSDKDL